MLEINAAVDFSPEYSLDDDVFDGVVAALVSRVGTSPNSLPPPEQAVAAA